MSEAEAHDAVSSGFTASRERFDSVLAFLHGADAAVLHPGGSRHDEL